MLNFESSITPSPVALTPYHLTLFFTPEIWFLFFKSVSLRFHMELAKNAKTNWVCVFVRIQKTLSHHYSFTFENKYILLWCNLPLFISSRVHYPWTYSTYNLETAKLTQKVVVKLYYIFFTAYILTCESTNNINCCQVLSVTLNMIHSLIILMTPVLFLL